MCVCVCACVCDQLLDLPGIIEGAKDGKGRGRQVIAVARTCVLIFMVLDVLKPLDHKRILQKELEGFGIRLNKTPPNISYKRKDKGGINLTCAVPQSTLDLTAVRGILSEYRVHNADVTLRCDATVDELIDVIEGNRCVGSVSECEVGLGWVGGVHLNRSEVVSSGARWKE